MIDKITLHNFKSFKEATLPLAPLTLLIGTNASGKSNAIEALQVLSWMAKGRRLGELQSAVREGSLPVRGQLRDIIHASVLNGEFGFGAEDIDVQSRLVLSLWITNWNDGLHIVRESLSQSGEGEPLYEVKPSVLPQGNEMQVAYNSFAPGGKKPTIACIDQQPVFTQLISPARFDAQHTKSQQVIPAAAARLGYALESILFLDPNPRAMRDYSVKTERSLVNDGANVSAVLYDLVEVKGREAEVLEFVRVLPEREIADIRFIATPRNEVMVQLVETFGGEEHAFEAALLSDGTLRVLAIAAALLSVPEETIVVIEEIDNGVHPSRAAKLVENIERVATSRKLRVLLTTHNPALLDALPTAAIPNVVVCYRDPTDGASRLMRLSDLPDYPELVARGPVGELVTHGVVERYVTAGSAGDKLKKALDWFDTLPAGDVPAPGTGGAP